jgi:hypothetical protein
MKHVMMIFTMVFIMTISVYAIETPVNLEITHNGTNVTLSWNAVNSATHYHVYDCATPYGVFLQNVTGSFLSATSWTKPEPAPRKFYKVTAVGGLTPVNLGTAGNFVILAKTGVSTVPSSDVTGNIGVSPYAATFITGFSLTMHSSGTYSTSTQVTGHVYAADYTPPTPSNLTTAVGDMELAYTDAAGRVTPDYLNLGAGNLSGLTLSPGLYKWGTGILITTAVTLNGGPNDVWIFQIAEGITMGAGATVTLAGGALPQNIFWQSVGVVSLDTAAHLEGIVLSSTSITLGTGATVNGRLLAQTAVTLDQSTVTQPTP